MKMILDIDNIRSIELDFPIESYPTCHICGNPMNEITIMPSCVFSDNKQYPKEEAKSVHLHFHHMHPNSVSMKRAMYCPFTGNKW